MAEVNSALKKVAAVVAEGHLDEILSLWRELDILGTEWESIPGEEGQIVRERIEKAKKELSDRYMRLA